MLIKLPKSGDRDWGDMLNTAIKRLYIMLLILFFFVIALAVLLGKVYLNG